MELSKRQREVLEMLDLHPHGRCLSLKQLRTSFNFMQAMYFSGLVDGSALPDDKGYGNYPETNLWEITTKGRQVIASMPPLTRRVAPRMHQPKDAPRVSTNAADAPVAPQRGVNAGETEGESGESEDRRLTADETRRKATADWLERETTRELIRRRPPRQPERED